MTISIRLKGIKYRYLLNSNKTLGKKHLFKKSKMKTPKDVSVSIQKSIPLLRGYRCMEDNLMF